MTQQDKPKRKIKPITESRWKMPAVAAGVIIILIAGVGMGFFAAQKQTTEPLPPQIAMAVDDACSTLASPIQNTPIPQDQTQQGQAVVDMPEEATGEPVTFDDVRLTATSLAEMLVEPTGTPMPTNSPAPTMPPPDPMSSTIEESGETRLDARADGDIAAPGAVDDKAGSDVAIGGMAGGGEALPDTGGGGDAEPELAIEYASAPPVVTSVGSFEGRDTSTTEAYGVESDGMFDTEESADTVAVDESDRSVRNAQQQIQPLRAGEIDDNADWDIYQEYRHNYFQQYSYLTVNDRDVTDRQIIRVVDENGLPVLGACVQVYLGTSLVTQHRTFATGMTMFFPDLLDRTRYVDNFRVVASKNGVASEAELDRKAIGDNLTIELPIEQQITPQLDVVFLIDATGSMSDEIQQLQDNILSISSQIDTLPGNVDVRYGLVSYRDFGDDYVTRVYDFTENVYDFQRSLRQVNAGGGGDTPEALNEGLAEALKAVEWRGENTVKLIFLVTDAPPHIDYNNGQDYSISMFDALAQGIKIHPIASSGLDPVGEFILRQIGQATMGHFIFLTYEGNNVSTPGDDRTDLEVGTPEDEQGVGDYSVSQLDELVLRLITDELAALQGE